MNFDAQMLRRRLHEELGGLPVQPAPVQAVTSRGRSVRARRRIVAACAAAVAAAVAALLAVPALVPGALVNGSAVTMNTPDPAAPGGVFASGTALGDIWQLAVRNIASPGLGCLPAVTLNGHHADMLPARPAAGPAHPGNSAELVPANPVGYVGFLTQLPSEHNVGFGFVAVHPGVTRVSVELANQTHVDAQPVTVTSCGEKFQLAGFAYAGANPRRITAFSGRAQTATTTAGWVPFEGHYTATPPTGMWETTPTGMTRPVFSGVAGQGTIGSTSWQIKVRLGGGVCQGLTTSGPRRDWWTACWDGDCFIASANRLGGVSQWQSLTCVPIEVPPAGIRLTQIPAIGASVTKGGQPSPELTAYAGLVGARTTHAVAYLSDGTTRRLTPTVVAGREYLGIAVAKQVLVNRIDLYDAARHGFAVLTSMPTSCGVQPVPPCGTYSPR